MLVCVCVCVCVVWCDARRIRHTAHREKTVTHPIAYTDRVVHRLC